MSKYIDVAINCLRDEAEAILHLIDNLNDDFDRAVELILHCRSKLIVTGVGKSGHIGAKIAATLSSTGTPSFFVLALSNSGQTDELLRFLPYLLTQKIPVIGMTGNPKSQLAQYSTVHLNVTVAKEAGPLGLAPTSSTTAALAMGDALSCALMDARDFKASDFAQFHPGGTLGRRLLTKAKDIMRTEDLPIIPPSMPLGEAVIHVSNGRLGLCVAQEEGKIVGIITDGDIRRAIQASRDNFFQTTVAEVMTRTPKTVSPEAKVSEIESILNTNKIHCVLVTAPDGSLLGIVDSFRTAL